MMVARTINPSVVLSIRGISILSVVSGFFRFIRILFHFPRPLPFVGDKFDFEAKLPRLLLKPLQKIALFQFLDLSDPLIYCGATLF